MARAGQLALGADDSRLNPVGGVGVSSPAERDGPSTQSVLRVIALVVASAAALYLLYLLRQPVAYLVLAAIVAAAVAGPVNTLSRRLPRGAAIALVYAALVVVPLALLALIVPPAVRSGAQLVEQLPRYVQEARGAAQKSDRLTKLNETYRLTEKLGALAQDAASALGEAAATLASIGAGVLGSIAAVVTVLILSAFMVARGREWLEVALVAQPPTEAQVIRRVLDRSGDAIGAYIAGAILQAAVAGTVAFIVLIVLGVPSALALALLVAIFDIVPYIGPLISGVLVGIVTLFTGFPVDTLGWAAFAIAYQGFENYVVQPRIQAHALELDPFLIVVSIIFGATLLGVLGAMLAIPAAATLQIAGREYLAYRRGPPVDEGGHASTGATTSQGIHWPSGT